MLPGPAHHRRRVHCRPLEWGTILRPARLQRRHRQRGAPANQSETANSPRVNPGPVWYADGSIAWVTSHGACRSAALPIAGEVRPASARISGHHRLPAYPDMIRCPDMPTSSPTEGPYRIYTPQTLGSALQHYRRRSGLTQLELARRAGINRTYLSELEQGPDTEQLRRLFRVLKQLGLRMSVEPVDE
jgi:HTH-type transcriptional regulator/antitoxin HipB